MKARLQLLSKMKLPCLTRPRVQPKWRKPHSFEYEFHSFEDFRKWDSYLVYMYSGIEFDRLQEAWETSGLKRVRDLFVELNPQFLSAEGVVDFLFSTCQCKCIANEHALLLAGVIDDRFFYAVFRTAQS